MSQPHEISPAILARQHAASDPAASVWVSANAGSGKTHVLTRRVVRLLLQGVPPSKILCLTFTKAAAANMAVRVFDNLAAWTRLSDEELRKDIAATGAPEPNADALRAARTLFARTVETPGGLKIQTIHAFCEKLLHLFPFEANVCARFEVADEARQTALLARARLEVLAGHRGSGAELAEAVAILGGECSEQKFESLIKEAIGQRSMTRARWRANPDPVLRKALGLRPGRDVETVEREMVVGGLAPARWREIAAFLDGGKSKDQDRARLFRQSFFVYEAQGGAGLAECLDSYLRIFFIEEGFGAPAKSLCAKDLAKARPDIESELFDEQLRLEGLREERRAAASFSRSRALIAVFEAVLERYDTLKAARGILDFDDLVERALSLLDRSESAWVLYKLDAGIDHILVDEAQDTSAAQWRILERLIGEFAVGATRSGPKRTFFAVGDEKQSIFSFQGAAPQMFSEMRRKLETKFKAGGEAFAHIQLGLSFRSAPGVLEAVDQVFASKEHQEGLIAPPDVWTPHEALKGGSPSLVEIWPLVGPQAREEPRDWTLPLDLLDAEDPASIVAERVARKIAQLTDQSSGEMVIDSRDRRPRPIRPGDILILVRARGPFFEAVIRALKQNKTPVAGADRLELAEHIAVMDLIAAGRAALLPQDDLCLASLLKSPLIGLDDEDLLALAPGREGALVEALAQSSEARHKAALAAINLWRSRAGSSPFSFFSRLLGEDGGRRALTVRLGPEATDAINEFLSLALAYEAEAAPSLVGFLNSFVAMERSIKRDMEAGADHVRVMTVHAAKGLEAKIIFLPDACSAPSHHHDPQVFALDSGDGDAPIMAFSPRAKEDCAAIAAAREKSRRANLEEYRRLLYVALTRAEERLYIAGFHGERAPKGECWAAMIQNALDEKEGFESVPSFWSAEEKILRRASQTLGASLPQDGAGTAQEAEALATDAKSPPDWLSRPPAPEKGEAKLRPSRAAVSSARGESVGARREALIQGRLVHVLLQYLPDLPPERRTEAALAYLSSNARDLAPSARRTLADMALAVISEPSLADLFGPGAAAEAPVVGRIVLPGGGVFEVSGQVDRIAETAEEILVADFKTGKLRTPEEVPAEYLVQMALYRAVLAPLWPGKTLRMLLIFTAAPLVLSLNEARLDAALAAFARERAA